MRKNTETEVQISSERLLEMYEVSQQINQYFN